MSASVLTLRLAGGEGQRRSIVSQVRAVDPGAAAADLTRRSAIGSGETVVAPG